MIREEIVESNTKQHTRKQILDTAYDLFVAKGYVHTQMKDIYTKIGISKKTLYRYYSSKEELAFEVEMYLFNEKTTDAEILKKDDETYYEFYERLLRARYTEYAVKNEKKLKFFVQFNTLTMEEYPKTRVTEKFISYMKEVNKKNYYIFEGGQKDGSITKRKSADDLRKICNHTLSAVLERYISRKQHSEESGITISILDDTVDMLLLYIKA